MSTAHVSHPQPLKLSYAIEGGFSQMNKFIEENIALAYRDHARAIDLALLRVDHRYGMAYVRRSTKDVVTCANGCDTANALIQP